MIWTPNQRYSVRNVVPAKEPQTWEVVDFQDNIVCVCSKQHNASLICKLLEYGT